MTEAASQDDNYEAPGLRRLKRKGGRIDCYWVADKDLVKAGYPQKTQRFRGDITDPTQHLDIARACRRLQAEMLEWKAGRKAVGSRSARGSVGFLCEAFETDDDSPFRTLRADTQIFYRRYLKIIKEDAGENLLDEVTGKTIRRWHGRWEPLGLRGQYACIQTFRRIVAYGVECAEKKDDPCLFIAKVLEKMAFKSPTGRTKRATHEHVAAFRPKADAAGRASIALAVTLQFDLGLRQKDVIGEWVRAGDGSREGIMDGAWRWQIGLTWAHVDSDWILRKPTSKSNGNEIAEHDLKAYPETLALLQMVPAEQRIGPVVLDEHSGKPWRRPTFSREFRKIANASGWPADVWNMDSRAGAVSEAFEAGADAADVMKAATHTQMSTTMGYNRGGVVQSGRVAELRIAKRKRDENIA